ncbi:TKL protein kinase [Phytophthora nicotianae P10297]|uniref:TKL protein kinase n=3 Tax=Phytophthora nicotianae TaxID=4792 RepID=W2Z620_PHYNI|nr:TKL protein kinase [Phytophthora nicotianae]ETO65256.1 TKL protein kinase [Phytophthora nicotianae P1976]ETP42525.1 TKL protein kinase [Phytophthora nicotianae P10297]
MVLASTAWCFSALLLVLSAGSSRAAECTALTENILTSSGCPSDCDSNPCVLYSPSQDESCVELGASGPCYSDDDFTLPGTSTECNVTYQCLDSLLWDGNQWLLALEANAATASKTMAYVTQITDLTYSTSTLSVQLQGYPTGSTNKNNIKDISLDQTFFDTPSTVVSMFLLDVNLRNTITSVSLATTYQTLYLTNDNLNAIPDQFANFTAVTKLDLSFNYITELPDNSSDVWSGLGTVTDLNLAENELTDFPVVLSSLQTLNLTGNAYTTIPDNVYTMAESGALKYLYMANCNLTNLQVSASQLALLENLATFDADVAITDCGSGYLATTLTNADVQVCTVSTSSSDDGGGSHTLAIVLGVCCGVLVLAIIAFLWYRKKHGGQFGSTKGGSTIFGTDIGSSLTGGDTTFGSSIWDDPDLLAARIEHRDVEAVKLLSRGGFGEVWLGLYMNENVAIKRLLNDKKSMQDALAFATEIKTMARLDHPKIVHFIGVSWTNALTIQAVTEFMDCGDLKSLLDSSRASSLTWANLKCQIAIDIADALVYLHTLNPKLIHRDLKSRNVLIDAQTGAKLSDFGISRNRSFDETMTAGVGTARWIAPEVILGGHYTEFADIYSFGVVLSELDTCKAPFYDATNTNGGKMQDVTILQLVSAGKLQPSFSDSCPPSIVKLARACLSFDPAQRPSAIHISYELRKIMKDEL